MEKRTAYFISWYDLDEILQEELNDPEAESERVDEDCYRATSGGRTLYMDDINKILAKRFNLGEVVGYAVEDSIILVELQP
ncbi:MAG: hypothetical protein EOM14_12030 [Clostridia bacterium]|nr:hypothetical protein [Clostridia bacterium]